jgi:predicted  nucleic acid-binding Zn-ribbon protein
MWFPIVAWIVLLSASAFFVGASLDLDPAQISVQFAALPGPQRFSLGAVIVTALALIGAGVWQTYSLTRQNQLLRDRLKGLRHGVLDAHGSQKDFDAAVQTLVDNDPEEAIETLHRAVTDTEQKVVQQQSRSRSVDMQERLDAIRLRQQALRASVGVVAEKRRVIEPVFGELRDRQRQLERSLSELEVDDSKNNLGHRLNELEQNVALVQQRERVLQESLAALNRFQEELGKSQVALAPLRAPETGIYAMVGALRRRHAEVVVGLDALESSDGEPIAAHVEALSRNKVDIEQRMARLDDAFRTMDAIRLDFETLRERRTHLERAFAEVETDADGNSLSDRQNALVAFNVQSQSRLRNLQVAAATLSQIKDELARSQTELTPLNEPVFGIEALISDIQAGRELLSKTLDEMEVRGDQRLDSRVEQLSSNKREIDERMAHLFGHFQKLDSMRKDIGEIFSSIRNTLNRIG